MKNKQEEVKFYGEWERDGSRRDSALDSHSDEQCVEEGSNSCNYIFADENKICIKILETITDATYDEVAPRLIDIVITGQTSDILLFIDSKGGALNPTLNLVRLLKSMDNKIITVAINNCMSSACLLFSLGKERYMLSGTKYMIHQLTASPVFDTSMPISGYTNIVEELTKLEAEYKQIILNSSKIPKNKLEEIFSQKSNTFFTEEEILKYNLATKIFTKFSELPI